MAINIPGFVGSSMPAVFSRDQVASTGTSIPGGLRILSIVGEGARQETLVFRAIGNGQDGLSPSYVGNATPDGRHFALSLFPIVSNRTTLLLNGVPLNGVEQLINDLSFDSEFDYRIDIDTGHIELQGASLVDQGASTFLTDAGNYGDGTLSILEVANENDPAETWLLKCIAVAHDAYGTPISKTETFTLQGTVSGQVKNSNGTPILFGVNRAGTDGYYDVNYQYIPGLAGTTGADGYFAKVDNTVSLGYSPVTSAGTSNLLYSPSGGFLKAAVGDTVSIAVTGTPTSSYVGKITTINNDKVLTLDTPLALSAGNITSMVSGFTFHLNAPFVLHTLASPFYASDIGLNLRSPIGDFTIAGQIDTTTIRLTGAAVPTASVSSIEPWATFSTNGLINVAIVEGIKAYEVGDNFTFTVFSRKLNQNDSLVARYIAISDINSPEFFTNPADLYAKHGLPSAANTLSLGAQLAFTNSAPGVFAVGAAPGLARRTTNVLIQPYDGKTAGLGFDGDATNPQVDSLRIPLPKFALPSIDTNLNISILRRDASSGAVSAIAIFPNKVPFYNSAYETPAGESAFVSNFSYSYTMIQDHDITQFGEDGATTASSFTFKAALADFKSTDALNALGKGNVIRITGGTKNDGTRFDTFDSSILNDLTGLAADGSLTLRILSVLNSTTVVFETTHGAVDLTTSAPYGYIGTAPLPSNFFKIALTALDWQLIDASQSTTLSTSVLLTKDIVTTGTLRPGDGITIDYVDTKDATFFDANWLNAYESLEAVDVQMVVPLPTQTISGIFQAGLSHVESQSYIANKHERVLLIGAITGITPDAVLGNTEVAVEDLVPPETIGPEDLANYGVTNAWGSSSRVIYMYPDAIIVNVGGALSQINGFYLAAAAGGYLAGNQNVAEPLTNKALSGFTIPSNRQYKPSVLNNLAAIGITVVAPITGGGLVLWGKTTADSGLPEDEEISIRFIRDQVQKTLRKSLQGFIGAVETPATLALISSTVVGTMQGLLSQGIITDFGSISVARDSIEPRQINVGVQYAATSPINWVFIDLEVSI